MFLTKVMLPSLHSPPFTYALLMTPKKFYWAIPGHIFGFFEQKLHCLQQINVKNVFPMMGFKPRTLTI